MSIVWDTNRRPAETLLDAIGRTPLVRLRRVVTGDVELLAKVEWYGPTGSVKDRIYAHMLTRAEERGDLRPGMTIVECTTGNAGIACAAVAPRQTSSFGLTSRSSASIHGRQAAISRESKRRPYFAASVAAVS